MTNRYEATITARNREQLARAAAETIRAAPAGHLLTIEAPVLSRLQQKKFHAMIGDIAAHCVFAGRRWRPDSWKRILVAAYVDVERDDAEARGDPNPFPDRTMLLVGIDGGSVVHLGEQTRYFSRAQTAGLIESFYSYGCTNNVPWSKASKNFIADFRQACTESAAAHPV